MQHLEQIKSVFEEYYNWSRYRISFLGNLISAIIRSRSVNMQKVAENIEGKAKTQSNYRRIQRLFKEQEFDFDITARLLSTVLPEDEQWILTMDRTNWKLGKSNINILVLAVAYKGMAIPLLWKFLTKEEEGVNIGKRGNSDTAERKELMESFIKIFGKERIKALTADREFIGEKWFEWLIQEDIPFVIRIRNNILLDQEEFDAVHVDELFKDVKKDEFYTFGKTTLFGQALHLGGIRSSKAKEPLVVVSNKAMDKETIPLYQKRWEIETMFGAMKSRGFNFEESKINEEEKINKLMALLCISFMWSILAGEYRAKQEPIANKKKPLQDLPNQESFQTWARVAQKRIGQFNDQEEGVFCVA